MLADDLMAAVFPDAAACLENIPGDRTVPDHPLVSQTIRDCLQEAMDYDGLAAVLARIHRGELRCIARDTPEPSPLAHELLNARPYAFLDDAPLEERRAHAVYTRRAGEPSSAGDLGALDLAAIERVRHEAQPEPRDGDELHDALLTAGFLTEEDAGRIAHDLFEPLIGSRRAARVALDSRVFVWVAAERLPEVRAVHAEAAVEQPIAPPATRASRTWTRDTAIAELLRGRLTLVGPTTARALAASLAISESDAETALHALEAEGGALRGAFTPGAAANATSPGGGETEWCDRRLLARIHRYTLNRLRGEIEPVSPADFMRFLFSWQHVDPPDRLTGIDGLREAMELLDGFELAAGAWERAVLPVRIDRYEPAMLDLLCLTGEIGWARLSTATAPGPEGKRAADGEPDADGDPAPAARLVGATPIALFQRRNENAWQTLRFPADVDPSFAEHGLADTSRQALEILRIRGASFFHELIVATGLEETELRRAIGELVAAGLVASDGFTGLRSLVSGSSGGHLHSAGRWSILGRGRSSAEYESAVEAQARALLRRYGVVFRRLLVREANAVPWRVLTRVYRRLEMRGEIRGGRFAAGMSGEQFALPDAVSRLREVRREQPNGRVVVVSAADPLNLAGIITAGDRVRAAGTTRLAYRNGVPLAAMEGDYMRALADVEPGLRGEVATALAGRPVAPILQGFVGRSGNLRPSFELAR
jgi:ATP-dependent Lhr-like helicase